MNLVEKIILAAALVNCASLDAFAEQHKPDFEKIADAIRVAEGCNPRWWYGMHHEGFDPLSEREARRRCLLFLQANWRYCPPGADFIHFVATRYCGGDWGQWERNVKSVMRRHEKGAHK